ncbi:MAG: hypothetical protein ABJH08_10450 [Balneola sp.]
MTFFLYQDAITTDGPIADNQELLFTSLLILICVNLIVEIAKFTSSFILSNKEKRNHKHLLIDEKRIKILEEIYKDLDSLSIFNQDEQENILEGIRNIERKIQSNMIYIPSKIHNICIDVLDYYKSVLVDYRKKDFEKEANLLKKYCNEFNK